LQTFILALHILACLILIVIVLLQSGKEGMGVIFGGGSGTVFGSSGAGGLLTKLTAILAAVFLITSLTYNILTSHRTVGEKSQILDLQTQETMEPVPLPEGVPPMEQEQGAEKPDSAPEGIQIEENTAPPDHPLSGAGASKDQGSKKSKDEIPTEKKDAAPAKE